VHGGNVGLGKLMSFIHVYALGGENLGPAIGESGGGTIRVLGGGPIASDNGQVHSLAVEGGPKLEQPLELGGSASFGGEVPCSFSLICLSICALAIFEAHS
jgi:hypothetical protein